MRCKSALKHMNLHFGTVDLVPLCMDRLHVSKIIDVLGHDSALSGYTGPGKIWANEMNFVVNHAPGAGLFAQTVDQQSSVLLLYHGCLHLIIINALKINPRKTNLT